jgi:hypothetical protein
MARARTRIAGASRWPVVMTRLETIQIPGFDANPGWRLRQCRANDEEHQYND